MSDAEVRRRIERLAGQLIPAADGMPSAAEVGVAGDLLDQVLAARPDLGPLLERAVALDWGDDAVSRVAELRALDAEAVDALTTAIAGGYYLHPRVRSLLGYPGQEAEPVNARIVQPYLTEGLLDPVVERGERYRQA